MTSALLGNRAAFGPHSWVLLAASPALMAAVFGLNRLRQMRATAASAVQAAALSLVLRPASDWLPSRVARGLAQLIGLIIAVSPTRGHFTYSFMRKTFGSPRARAFAATHQLLALPFCDFVVLRRVANHREDISKWKVEERGHEAIEQIRKSGQPFLLATAHFSRESAIAIFLPSIVPHRIGLVAAPVPPGCWDPLTIGMRLRYGQLLDALKVMRPCDLDFLFTGGSFSRLDKRLREEGNVIILNVDAYWLGGGPYTRGRETLSERKTRGTFVRPFAGHETYRVATGAAHAARLAQCPIVPCVTFIEDRRRVVEWGKPICPPLPSDREGDVRITNEVLDHMECAVGTRPTQYVLNLGNSRCWNQSELRWEPARADETP
jgi:lauroyl/myristoyl acyltransferase